MTIHTHAVIITVITPIGFPIFMERPTYALFLHDNYDAKAFECTCENKNEHFICYPCLFGVGENNDSY